MYIQLTAEIYQQMEAHFHSSFPNEGCGLLLGTSGQNPLFHIHELIPARNIAKEPEHHFELDPETWVHHLMASTNLAGLFHTHPHAAPLPSAADLRALQTYGELIQVYLIAGLDSQFKTMELRAYEVTKQDLSFALRPAKLCMT